MEEKNFTIGRKKGQKFQNIFTVSLAKAHETSLRFAETAENAENCNFFATEKKIYSHLAR